MDIVSFVDEQHDGLAGLAHHLLEQAFPSFGLGGGLEIGVGAVLRWIQGAYGRTVKRGG